MELNKDNFESFIKGSGDKLAVVDFWATWCGPCRQFGPIFSKVAENFEGKGIVFAKANIDDVDSDILNKYDVKGIPCVVVFTREGLEVTRFVGALSEEKFTSNIKALIGAESEDK
jgi:thioredoxin 1